MKVPVGAPLAVTVIVGNFFDMEEEKERRRDGSAALALRS